MQEKENILRIFEETKEAIKEENGSKLSDLSNQTNNTASRTHDPDNIAVAVIVYSLSKIVERKKYRQYPGWNEFYKTVTSAIDSSIVALKKDDEKKVHANLNLITKVIGKLSGKLKQYIQDVFRKASINKASKIYEHGISMEKTAELLGITLFELASYAGQKDLPHPVPERSTDVRSRIKLVMEMFSG